MKTSRLLQWGRVLLALAIVFFLIKRFSRLLTGLEGTVVVFHPFWLIVSLGLLMGYRTLLVSPWRRLYRSASQEKASCGKSSKVPVSFESAWILFQLSQLGKYLPGKVGQFVGIIVLCRSLGLSKTEAVVSTLQGLVFQCCLGLVMGVPVLLSPSAKPLLLKGWAIFLRNAPLLMCVAIVILAGGCAVVLLWQKGQFFRKMPGLQDGIRSFFGVRETLRLLTVYLLLWGYFGITFFLFVKSIHPIQLSHLLMIIGIYPLAWSIGILSLVTPSGLGVREGILSVLLTLCLPPATAVLLALLSRGWVMSIEISLASVAWGLYSRHRRKNTVTEETAKT